MNKIIFDNTAAGFPADEQFMRVVDEHREAIVQLCFALFGDRKVILSGLEVTHTSKEENGVTTHTTVINEGAVWFNRDVRYVNRTELEGKVDIESIFLTSVTNSIAGIYHNGETHDTYSNKTVDIRVSSKRLRGLAPTHDSSVELSSFVRFDTFLGALKPRSTEHWVKDTGDIKYSLKAVEYMGIVNINGTISLPKQTALNSSVVLTGPSEDHSFTGYEERVLSFPCLVSYPNRGHNEFLEMRAIFKVIDNGATGLTLISEKDALPDSTNPIVTVYVNASYIV